jgi:hypothetical protein
VRELGVVEASPSGVIAEVDTGFGQARTPGGMVWQHNRTGTVVLAVCLVIVGMGMVCGGASVGVDLGHTYKT